MISDNYVPLRQLGNGVTVAFSASWNMLAASYARVFFEDTTTGVQTEQLTGWSISLAAGGAGWTVTFVTPPPSTVYVVIGRSVTLDQTDPYRTSRGWQGAVVEASFDKLTAVCQDISDVAARSIVFPLGDTATVTLPAASQRANLALVFDASGNATAGASTSATVSSAMIPVVGAASLAGARAALGVPAIGDVPFTAASASGAASLDFAEDTDNGTNKTTLSGQSSLTANNLVRLPATPGTLALLSDIAFNSLNDFRLTLTSDVPVTTTNVTGATTIFCTPFKGNRIALYDGTNWNVRTSAQFSLALGTLTSAKPYDVFCYDNAGVPTLELSAAWTNDTTRATALAYQDGVLVKSGDATRRYLGSFYTTSTTTTEDSLQNRLLFNQYNTVFRPFLRRESTVSWNYTTATVRYANGNSSNKVTWFTGFEQNSVSVSLAAYGGNNTQMELGSGIGLDSGTVMNIGNGGIVTVNNSGATLICTYNGFAGVGYHYAAWLEVCQASGTTTWRGVNTAIGSTFYSGLSGGVFA